MKFTICLLVILVSVIGCVTTPESGRKVFLLTSESEEARLGESAYREALSKSRRARDPKWNAILQRVGNRIAEAARKPDFRWEFALIESPEKNAWCLPGGKVAFYTGMLSVFENEAQMAAVMGHEVAHATARHAGSRMTIALGTELGLAAASALMGGSEGDKKKQLLLAALGLGANVGVALPFSRSHETEADEIGLIYMARAGYDPKEARKFWARFSNVSGGSGVPTFLSTHPASRDREENLGRKIPSVLSEYERSAGYGVGEIF